MLETVKSLIEGLVQTKVTTMKYFIFATNFLLEIVSAIMGLATAVKINSSRSAT